MRFFHIVAAVLAAVLIASCGQQDSKFRHYDGPEITQVQVFKEERRMHLISEDRVIKTYQIALGGNPVGPKQFSGDSKTPEGLYYFDRRNPNSNYHLSLGISYPNPYQVAFAAINGKDPGGDIFIHGRAGKDRGRGTDWTAGCIAVTDKEMEEIYAMVRLGTPIFIFP